MTDDRTTLLVRLREVSNASSDASGNPVKKLHTAEHGVLLTEPGSSIGYFVENFLPRYAAERTDGSPVMLTLAANGRVVGIDSPPGIGFLEPATATREEMAEVINDAAFEGVEYRRAKRLAEYLLARFTITPKTV